MSSLRKLTGFLRPYWKIAILGPIFMFTEVVKDLTHLPKGYDTLLTERRSNLSLGQRQLFVIDDGRIIEKGSHNELLEQRGFYHNMYMSQFKRQ